MDGALIAALGALGVALIGAFNTLFGKKVRAPADTAAERRDTIADRDAWITTLTARLDGMEVRLQAAESEIEQVRDHNNVLINYCYRLIAIVRRHGHEAEIPTPPPNGIHL